MKKIHSKRALTALTTTLAIGVGALLGVGAIPAYATTYNLTGTTPIGNYTYHGVFRWHYSSFPTSNIRLTSASPDLCGSSIGFRLYNGKGGESSEASFSSYPANAKSFFWNGSTTIPYPESYAIRSRMGGIGCSQNYVSWAATLNL